MIKIRGINPIEKEIVRTLYNEGIPLTITEISQKLGRPETVVRKHALYLKQKGVLDMDEQEYFLNCLYHKIRHEILAALQVS